MTPWMLGKVEQDGITYEVKAFNRIGEVAGNKTRCVLILTKTVFNDRQSFHAAVVDYDSATYSFITKPKTMDELERKMELILVDKSKGPVSTEAFEMASGMCLACFNLNEVIDAQMA